MRAPSAAGVGVRHHLRGRLPADEHDLHPPGGTLDPRVGSFRVPPAVLTVFDTLSVMLWVPLYDRAIVPLARRLTGHHRGFTQLTRMGIGFVVLTVAMLAAGMLEVARRRVVTCNGSYRGTDGAEYVSLSIFWQVPQYFIIGAAEVFVFVGQLDFFYDQGPVALRSGGLALCMSIMGVGNYASGMLVSAIDWATRRTGESWFSDNLNRAHLDYFYLLLAGLIQRNAGGFVRKSAR